VLLPLVVTFGLALYGIPALPTLVAGVFAGTFTTIFVQGRSFTAAWTVFLDGTAPETGMDLVNDLLASGGISGSAWTIAVVVAALSLGGLLERTGVLAVLAHHLATAVREPLVEVVPRVAEPVFPDCASQHDAPEQRPVWGQLQIPGP
ncbi:Na+/H+ antiporter NhaC family protein, partial [Haloferax sp. KTX1]|uniref:Na+/H+ antiporter NhaC family protein n=1 Tax=Haloferax sp. KTX1 TaxID=2600597 RepID=UPI00272E9A2B